MVTSELLFDAVRNGSLSAVRALIADGWDVNRLSDISEATPLHVAVWRNDLAMIEVLLQAGADASIRDGESGWTALHRCLHWGHLQAAATLLQAGAALDTDDTQGVSPIGLIASTLKGHLASPYSRPEVFSWGSGANYQLGTGSTGVALTPCRVEALHEEGVVQIASAKYHSAAVTADGRLLTWGFGRGGRLGHPELHIFRGDRAVITPQPVTSLGSKQVSMVAVAKHHCLLKTAQGEVFSWGSNRDGVLGYTAQQGQATPRAVSALRGYHAVSVAAATRHSAAVTASGAIFTWGFNGDGQLGHTSMESAFHVPRMVDALKGRGLCQVAAAERHSAVLTDEGDILQWGHGSPLVRRILLAGCRDMSRANGESLVFHRGHNAVSRPQASYIVAGEAFSGALTRDGVALVWTSWDAAAGSPALTAVGDGSGPLAGRRIVSLSAGRERMAVVTDDGEVFMWEGLTEPPSGSSHAGRGISGGSLPPQPVSPERVPGLRRVMAVAVGDRHSLALQWWSNPWSNDAAAAPSVATEQRPSQEMRPGSSKLPAGEDELEESRLLFDVEDDNPSGTSDESSDEEDRLWRLAADQSALNLGQDVGYHPSSMSDTRSIGGSPRSSHAWTEEAAAAATGTVSSRRAGLMGYSPEAGSSSFRSEGFLSGASPGLGAALRLSRHGSQAGLEGGSRSGSSTSGLLSIAAAPFSVASNSGHDATVGEGMPLSGSLCTYGSLPSIGGWKRPTVADLLEQNPYERRGGAISGRVAPTLELICQRVVAAHLVEPRTALEILEYAEMAGSGALATYCKQVAVANLDAVLLEAPETLAFLSPHLLKDLEDLLKVLLKQKNADSTCPPPQQQQQSSQQPCQSLWAPQASLRPTSVPPVLSSSSSGPSNSNPDREDEVARMESIAHAVLSVVSSRAKAYRMHENTSGHLPQGDIGGFERARTLRGARKKLAQIRDLDTRPQGTLDHHQRLKLATKPAVEGAVQLLECGGPLEDALELLAAVGDARGGALGASPAGEALLAAAVPRSADAAALSLPAAARGTAVKKPQVPATQAVPGMEYMEEGASSRLVRVPSAVTQPKEVRVEAGALELSGLEEEPPGRRERERERAKAGWAIPRVPLPLPRRGGLSLFLRGEMDAKASAADPCAAKGASAAAPPWSSDSLAVASASTPVLSLRDIQQQEEATVTSSSASLTSRDSSAAARPGMHILSKPAGTRSSEPGQPPLSGSTSKTSTLSLADFMTPKPRKPAPRSASGTSPAWGGLSGTSPSTAGASLLDIQAQQLKESGHSLQPGLDAAWASSPPASHGSALPQSSSSVPILRGSIHQQLQAQQQQQSKWFVPDPRHVVSLAAIQSEEAKAAVAAAAAQQKAEEEQQQRVDGKQQRPRGNRKREGRLPKSSDRSGKAINDPGNALLTSIGPNDEKRPTMPEERNGKAVGDKPNHEQQQLKRRPRNRPSKTVSNEVPFKANAESTSREDTHATPTERGTSKASPAARGGNRRGSGRPGSSASHQSLGKQGTETSRQTEGGSEQQDGSPLRGPGGGTGRGIARRRGGRGRGGGGGSGQGGNSAKAPPSSEGGRSHLATGPPPPSGQEAPRVTAA